MTQEDLHEEVRASLDRSLKKLTKRTNIIFDGKQYNIRIPLDFVKKARVDPEKEEFEFILTTYEDKEELPTLQGEVVEKD